MADEYPGFGELARSSTLEHIAEAALGLDGRRTRKVIFEAPAQLLDTVLDPGSLTEDDLAATVHIAVAETGAEGVCAAHWARGALSPCAVPAEPGRWSRTSWPAVQAISATEAVGRMLIAAGHLRQHSITLVAGKVHCEITTAVAQACPVSTGERRSTWSATASPLVEPITGFEAPETTNYR
ncbi:hypothetical protein [Streptomyces rubiginosohelvolus]|nr:MULTISPECIES: hypothetical protein [Streptomyces]